MGMDEPDQIFLRVAGEIMFYKMYARGSCILSMKTNHNLLSSNSISYKSIVIDVRFLEYFFSLVTE